MGAIFGFTGAPDPARLTAMQTALAHRGNDLASVSTATSTVGVLPALSASEAAAAHARGMVTSGIGRSGDIVVALAGYLLASSEVPSLSMLAERFGAEGVACLRPLRGAFVIAIVDHDQLIVVRDGGGVRTAYHLTHAGRRYFAVEPKAIVNTPGFARRIRPAAVAQYLSYSFLPGETTMLEGVHELLPGQWIDLAAAQPTSHMYFDVLARLDEGGAARSEADWLEEFRALHAAAVRERAPRGEKVAVFLSGGLDSSVVTAELCKQHDGNIQTFSIHFGPEHPNELSYAEAVAKRCGTEHHEVHLDPNQFLPRLRKIIWHLDDPIGDPITAPNFELAERVRKHARWAFNGEGGDPLFGGPKNIPMMLHHWYGGIERDDSFRARMYLQSYRRSYEEWPVLMAPEWAKQVDAKRDLEDLLTPYFDATRPAGLLNKLSLINIKLKGAHLILPKVDRMTGASGLLTLSPLFDERLLQFSFAMPPTLKLCAGIEKIALKRAYQNDLPEQIIARPKSGMRVPVQQWFRGPLRAYAQEVLSEAAVAKAGIFDPKRVAKLLAYESEEGPGRFGLRLWMLLTFELWRRIVVEGEAP